MSRSKPTSASFNLDDLISALNTAPSVEPGWVSTRELMAAMGIGDDAVRVRLRRLHDAGKLESRLTNRPSIAGTQSRTFLYRLKPTKSK